MNDLLILAQEVLRDLPEAQLEIELNPKSGWLDVLYLGRWVAVEWRPGQGFGVSLNQVKKEDPLEGLFAGPDFIFADWAEAKDHILSLLHAEAQPEPRRVAHG